MRVINQKNKSNLAFNNLCKITSECRVGAGALTTVQVENLEFGEKLLWHWEKRYHYNSGTQGRVSPTLWRIGATNPAVSFHSRGPGYRIWTLQLAWKKKEENRIIISRELWLHLFIQIVTYGEKRVFACHLSFGFIFSSGLWLIGHFRFASVRTCAEPELPFGEWLRSKNVLSCLRTLGGSFVLSIDVWAPRHCTRERMRRTWRSSLQR